MAKVRALGSVFRLLAGWLLALLVLALLGVRPSFAQPAPDQVIFGPTQYTRTTSSTNLYTASFSVPADVGAPFLLRVENGNANGQKRVTSASVTLNGVQVVTSSELGQSTALVEKSVTLSASNTLQIEISGTPGNFVTLSVLGTPIRPQPTSLSPDPLSVVVGASGTLTATLSPVPPVAGTLLVGSANSGIATVPGSVAFAAGQSTVQIPVSGVALGTTAVSASANGGSASATVNVVSAPPTVTQLAPASITLTQGSSGTLTVTISAAQGAGTDIALASSNSAIASVPAFATVPAGQVSASIAVSALSAGDAQITASLNGSSATSQVAVTPAPPTVVSLLPAVSSVTLGAGTTLTLTISSAQATDTVVPLTVTPEGIVTAPPQVVVPAGQLAVPVAIGTLAYGQAGITASLNGSTASAAVNVVPPPVALTALEPASFTMTVGATSSFTVRINAAQTTNTEVQLASSDPTVLQVPGSVIIAQGQTSASFTATALAAGGVILTASANGTEKSSSVHVAPQPAALVSLLPTPLPLQQGASGSLTVTIDVAQEADTSIALGNADAAVASVPASVIVLAGAVTAQVSVSALSPGSTEITATLNGTLAASTVEVTPPPPVVTAITPASLSLPKGTPGVLRVTVSRAPSVATAVALATTNAAVASVPPQVNIPAGALHADFPVASNAAGQATVSASLNGGSAASVVTVSAAELAALSLSPQTPSVFAGEALPFTATGTLTDGTTEDFTSRVTWNSSDTAVATISSTGVASPLAPGATTIEARYSFTAAQTGEPVTIAQNTLLTVKQAAALVLSAPSTSLQVGQSVLVTVTTSDPAPAGGLAVSLSGGGTGNASIPAGVTIPESQTSASFQLTATQAGDYTLNATASNRLPGTLAFSIQPQLAITAVTPASAEVGAIVTLSGTSFDPVAANNQLVFRGINNTTVPAAPLTASATQITVRVPPLADTGPITLTNSRGTVQSPPFTVTREQDFELVVSPAAVTVYQGASNDVQAQLSSTGTRSFTGLVNLSVQGLPAGVTASFSPAQTLSAFQAGTVTLAASGAASPGSYSATVQATFTEGGAPFVRSSPLNVTVAAATNVTGLKGRFVTPEGHGIAGVIVRADTGQSPQPQTTTDAAGNFVLTGLPAGEVTFRFDATPANPLYPIWPYTTVITANQISVLSAWTINPPPTDDKFTPIANATQDQVIVDERFPGLAIKLPAGVSIIGWDGVPKTRIAVEKIMPDKLPVTAPPVPIRESYQLYFGTPMGGIPSQPIPVTLPNVSEMEPGDQVEIWFFDGSPMGGTGEWKLAGMGTVSPDGKTVGSNPGVGIPRFCGVCGLLSLGCPPPPTPPQPPPGNGCPECGKPVDLFTGQELMSMDLMSLTGLTPINLTMKYNPVDAYNNRAGTVGSVGFGWTLSYDVGFLPFDGPQKRIVLPGSRFVNFVDDGSGLYKAFDDPRFEGAAVTAINQVANEWRLKFREGQIWRFKPFAGIPGVIRGGPPTFLTEVLDTAGNALSVARQPNGRIASIGSPERNLVMTYGANGFVSEIRDTSDRITRLTYTSTNRIETVTDSDGKVTRFTYVDDTEIPPSSICQSSTTTGGERLKTILFPGRLQPAENFYGSSRRVLRQVGYDGLEYRMSYKVTGACITHVSTPNQKCSANCPELDSWESFQAGWRFHGGRIVGVTVNEPGGHTDGYGFNARGTTSGHTDSQGQSTTNKYDSSSRLIERRDPLGRTSKYTYAPDGNLIRMVDPIGRTMDFEYDAKWQVLNRVTRYLEDNIPVVGQFRFDSSTGRLLRKIDPVGNVTEYGYTATGQVSSITEPGNRTTSFGYSAAGDLISLVNPLGHEATFEADGAGRTTRLTDPLGFSTTKEYNDGGQLKTIIDPLQGATRFEYDPAGRLSAIIDPRGNAVESYEFDAGDRLKRRIDAFDRWALYSFDPAGRLASITDRKGQQKTYGYNAQNLITRVEYADGSVQTRTYDAGGRLSEIREPDSVIAYSYDVVDRVVKVTTDTAAGRYEVAYEYDALDRVIRRTVNGGDPMVYTYDKANRPETITYRGRAVTYFWDESNRLASRILPNGIAQSFTYDDAHQLTGIEYRQPDGAVIDSVAYTYDANGQRLKKTTLGQPSVQETPFTAAYDAANRMTGISFSATGTTFILAYDENGNLISKTDQADSANVTTYAWDTRNRLVGIDGPGLAARFVYDGLNRRIEKTVNGQVTGYVYDGAQAIAEISGGAISAGLFTTLRIDEVLARYTQAGERTYLTDALGSAMAITRGDRSIQAFYACTAYGQSQALGDDEGNPYQYTGRENDQTGLLYYRARYYDPVLKRFIQEDPVGLASGTNVYAYVAGNPVLYIDPTGNEKALCFWDNLKEIDRVYTGKKQQKVLEEWSEWDWVVIPDNSVPGPSDSRGFPWPGGRIVWQEMVHETGIIQKEYKAILAGIQKCYDECGKLYFQGWGRKDGPIGWEDTTEEFHYSYPKPPRSAGGGPGPDDLPPYGAPPKSQPNKPPKRR